MYADCLLKNTSTKENKYVVNQTLVHVDDISFRELFGSIRVFFLENMICPVLAQSISIYVWPFFFMKHSWTNSLENLKHFFLDCRIYIQARTTLIGNINRVTTCYTLDIEFLTCGNDNLTYQQNCIIFKCC